jgi:hypothetical protein
MDNPACMQGFETTLDITCSYIIVFTERIQY